MREESFSPEQALSECSAIMFDSETSVRQIGVKGRSPSETSARQLQQGPMRYLLRRRKPLIWILQYHADSSGYRQRPLRDHHSLGILRSPLKTRTEARLWRFRILRCRQQSIQQRELRHSPSLSSSWRNERPNQRAPIRGVAKQGRQPTGGC